MGDMGERCELNTQMLDLDDIPDISHLPNNQTTTPDHQTTIDCIGNRLHLPTHVKDEACRMFINEGRFVQNQNRVVVAMACVYLSCMRCFIPRTVREILPERDRDRALRKEVKRGIESLGRECPLGACDASFFGKQFAGLLKMAEPVATKVQTGTKKYQSLNLKMNPYLAAAAIVFGYANSGPDICSVSGLSEEVIKATWEELWKLVAGKYFAATGYEYSQLYTPR